MFLKKKDKFISLVLKHIGTSALMDLLLRLVSCVEPAGLRQEVLRVSVRALPAEPCPACRACGLRAGGEPTGAPSSPARGVLPLGSSGPLAGLTLGAGLHSAPVPRLPQSVEKQSGSFCKTLASAR